MNDVCEILTRTPHARTPRIPIPLNAPPVDRGKHSLIRPIPSDRLTDRRSRVVGVVGVVGGPIAFCCQSGLGFFRFTDCLHIRHDPRVFRARSGRNAWIETRTRTRDRSVCFKESPSVVIDIFTRSREIDRSSDWIVWRRCDIARRARRVTTTARRGLRYSRHRGREHRRSLGLWFSPRGSQSSV